MNSRFGVKCVLYALIGCVLLTGCKSDSPTSITDDAIYSKLEVSFNQVTSKTSVKATFWKGSSSGEQVVFNEGASITYNDAAISRPYQTSKEYLKEVDGFVQTSAFKITDVNGKQFVNSIGAYEISLTADSVNSTQAWLISWTSKTPALDSGEVVTVRIAGKAYTQDTTGAKTIMIPASDLTGKKGMSFSVGIERLKTKALTQSLGAGGYISTQYIAIPKTVYFK